MSNNSENLESVPVSSTTTPDQSNSNSSSGQLSESYKPAALNKRLDEYILGVMRNDTYWRELYRTIYHSGTAYSYNWDNTFKEAEPTENELGEIAP